MNYNSPFDPPYETPLKAFNASDIPSRGTLYLERQPDSIVNEVNNRKSFRRLRFAQVAGLVAITAGIIFGANIASQRNNRPPHCQFFDEKEVVTPPNAGAEFLARQTKGLVDGNNICLDATINYIVDLNPDKDVFHPLSGETFKTPQRVVIDGKAPEQVSLSANQFTLAA